MKTKKYFYSVIALTLMLIMSCEPKETRTIDGNWEVISLKGQSDLNINPTFVIVLRNLKISGFSGCNYFLGSFTMDNNEISFGNTTGTKSLCPEMEIENLFVETLSKVNSYRFTEHYLEFLSESDDIIMRMKSIEAE